MSDFPKVVYSSDGSQFRTVASAEAEKALGAGWSDKFDAKKDSQAIRKAAGAIAETILPVTRTRAESV